MKTANIYFIYKQGQNYFKTITTTQICCDDDHKTCEYFTTQVFYTMVSVKMVLVVSGLKVKTHHGT